MKTWKLLATNTLAQMVGKVATAGSTLIITRLIADANGLGRDGYGEFSIVTVFAAYFYILTDFGLNAVAVKHISEDSDKTSYYFANLLSLRVVMSVGLMMVGLVILAFLPYSPLLKMGCMIMLLTVLAQGVLANSNVLFQAKLRYDQSVMSSVFGTVISMVLVFVSYKAHGGLFAYLLSMVAGYAVMAILSLIFSGTHTPVRLAADIGLWGRLFKEALPLGLTIVFNLAYFKADSFIMSFIHFAPSLHLTNEQATGLYNMAYKVFEVILTFPIFFVNVLYPMMVKSYQEDVQRFRRLVGWSLGGLLSFSFIVTAAIYITAPWLIFIVSSGNPQFAPSVGVLRLLSLSLPFFFLTNTLLWTIMTLGKQRVLAFFYAISAVVNVGLNLWLIPQYGYNAAAVTTGITELVTLLLLGGMVWSLFASGDWPRSGQAASLEEVSEATS